MYRDNALTNWATQPETLFCLELLVVYWLHPHAQPKEEEEEGRGGGELGAEKGRGGGEGKEEDVVPVRGVKEE